ncbi:MAG: M13 family metallopeptidase, partial [Lachnospiraceae bacterium]|nr:M13 family metallopeptidase [Candidatus Colinaster equi]
ASIASENNLDMLKAYSVIDILSYASDCTDEEANEISIEYINTISGVTGTKPIEEQAYDFVNDTYNELVGDMYARSTFTEEEKQAIEENVYDMIDIFRERMKVNDWLSEETRNTAIEKLNSMDVNIGYPEEMLNDFSGIKYDNNKDFFQNMLAIRSEDEKAWKFAAGKKFNKKAWGAIMSAATVNACYVPSQNSINFPAAILRKPYYDKDATLAYNMGGIGIVIGHEMSHAFDTNGSQYDKDGNLVNWWTDEDREAFRQRTKAVGERYAMYEILDGESPNADLVITETVADLAGTSVVLDLLAGKEKEGIQVNYEDFFIADATCWRRLLTKNVVQEKLKTDYHAPDFLRVNVNVSQFDKFYETFDIKEGDRMYTKPEDRLSVW